MAAFFAFMGRTIIGKYIPVLLAVMLFVAAGFQHSPANMGCFALHIAHGGALSWDVAIGWNWSNLIDDDRLASRFAFD